MSGSGGEHGIPEEATERLRRPELFKRYISGGKTFQEILGYSDKVMEGFYQTARMLFLSQKYEEAVEAFTFLSTLNPYVLPYWMGLGMADQLMGNYEKALISYGIAVSIAPKNPMLHYHSAGCYRSLGEKEKAIGALEITIACAEESDEHLELASEALHLLEALKT